MRWSELRHLLPLVLAVAVIAFAAARLTSTGDAGAAPVEIGPAPDREELAPEPLAGARAAHPAAGGDGGEVWVHVAGRVRRPGLYRLAPGARAAAALEAAGGPARGADLAAVNLAAHVADGSQVLVPRRGAAPAQTAGAPAGPGGAAAPPVSLSTATREQLEALDGIGPALAGRIIAAREARGGFRSVDELRQVEGIGEKRLAALRAAVRP